MTASEMDQEFKTRYDNISSNAAPGLTVYERSLFLTQAQDELVRESYNPYNKQQKGFEGSENRRAQLRELVTPFKTSDSFTNEDAQISSNSKFIEIPDDVYFILQEEIEVSGTGVCKTKIGVKPITHDEYNVSSNNPFRKPNKRKAWRLDIQNTSPSLSIAPERVVEIITPFNITKYSMRYLKKPEPIIVGNFDSDPETQGLGLTIEGENTVQGCQLNESIHRLIVDKAVELAIRTYRENSLQANVELNNRNV